MCQLTIYRTCSVISLLSSIVPLSNIVPQKLEKNINLEGKNKALSDIVRTLQKLKEIQAADSNRVRTVCTTDSAKFHDALSK